MLEHKVRGGSALSLALSKISPPEGHVPLGKSSPMDSTGSGASSQQTAGWLSSSAGSPGLLASVSPSPAGGSLAQAASSAPQQGRSNQRLRLPFLSCFGSSVGAAPRDDELPVAVSASEVGIRPCFYWLEAPAMSVADRLYAEANARWLKSDCQDDAVVIEQFAGVTHQTFAGVFDGHGPYGRNAAKYASTCLPQLLAAKLTSATSTGKAGERRALRALREAFLEVNSGMRNCDAAGFDASLSGTTACCALLVGRRVLVASTGDSRCVVARRGASGGLEVAPLTWDAKPSLPEEHNRILSAGGVVKQLLDERGEPAGAWRVFRRGDDVLPGLAMSRSLGDLYAHAVGVSAEPVLNTYTLRDRDLFLILATDGLWDIMGNEDAADFVERYKVRRAPGVSCAEALTLEAQERWKARHEEAIVDDISCIILHTAGLPPPERDSPIPRPLIRAASCNDEANELYLAWRHERERNPSNHRPQQYFKHLYGGEEQEGGDWQAAELRFNRAPDSPMQHRLASSAAEGAAFPGEQEAEPPGTPPSAALADSTKAPLPPATSLLPDAAQYSGQQGPPLQCTVNSSATFAAAVAGTAGAPPSPQLRLGAMERGSSGVLHRLDDVSSHSPHSSYGDLASENSEPSMRRGSVFVGGWGEQQRHPSSFSQPIPVQRRFAAASEEGPMSVPLESLLRPVRKAYPSSASLGQAALLSQRSDASLQAAAETPRQRSGEGAALEGKMHGGFARSLPPPRPGISAHASYSSLHSYGAPGSLLSPRGSTDMLSGGRRSHHEDRLTSDASSPSESLLGITLSPQTSPLAPCLGYGRSSAAAQLQASNAHYTRVLPTAPLQYSVQYSQPLQPQ